MRSISAGVVTPNSTPRLGSVSPKRMDVSPLQSISAALLAERGCIVDATGFDDGPHAARVLNIYQRVGLQHDDIRELARLERTKRLGLAERVRGRDGCSLQRSQRAEPRFHQQRQLVLQ